MKILVPTYVAKYEGDLSDRLKVTVSFIARLHRKYKGPDIFMFDFYDAKILMDVGVCSVHPPKSQEPLLCGNYGDNKYAIGLRGAKGRSMVDLVEWEIHSETDIALHTYLTSLFYTDFDFEGEFVQRRKRERRFSSTQLKELFNLSGR